MEGKNGCGGVGREVHYYHEYIENPSICGILHTEYSLNADKSPQDSDITRKSS